MLNGGADHDGGVLTGLATGLEPSRQRPTQGVEGVEGEEDEEDCGD